MKIKFRMIQIWRGLKVVFGISKFHHRIGINGFDNNNLYPLDLSEKIKFDYFEVDGIPKVKLTNGRLINFPIHQAQLALAYWDKYIKNDDDNALLKFEIICKSLIGQVDYYGRVDTWSQIRPNSSKYSAMAQSLVASVMLRYELFVIKKPPIYAEKLMNALVNEACFRNKKYGVLEEMPDSRHPCILNGWIYSLIIFFECERINSSYQYREFLDKQLIYLEKEWPNYLFRFGSYYDLGLNYASPFYHDLHIKQVKILNEITDNRFEAFYLELIRRNKPWHRAAATFIKGLQKLREPVFNEIQG